MHWESRYVLAPLIKVQTKCKAQSRTNRIISCLSALQEIVYRLLYCYAVHPDQPCISPTLQNWNLKSKDQLFRPMHYFLDTSAEPECILWYYVGQHLIDLMPHVQLCKNPLQGSYWTWWAGKIMIPGSPAPSYTSTKWRRRLECSGRPKYLQHEVNTSNKQLVSCHFCFNPGQKHLVMEEQIFFDKYHVRSMASCGHSHIP